MPSARSRPDTQQKEEPASEPEPETEPEPERDHVTAGEIKASCLKSSATSGREAASELVAETTLSPSLAAAGCGTVSQ